MSDEQVAIELAKIESSFSGFLKYGNVFECYKEILKKVKELNLDDKLSKIQKLIKDYYDIGDFCEFCKDTLIYDIKKVLE